MATTAEGQVSEHALRRVVDLARLAPSVHNTQPWSWSLGPGVLELWADRDRGLPVADPAGRDLTISCGTALHHAVVAARALRLQPSVEHLPDPTRPDLLACVVLRQGGPSDHPEDDLRALRERRTDRRRFTSWPVPDERVQQLARAGAHWGADAVPLVDVSLRFRVELMLERARLHQAADVDFVEETRRWVADGRADGIPATVLPTLTGMPGERPHRFVIGAPPERSERLVEGTDGLIVIATEHDGPLDWLCAGEALSALWLHATLEGLSVVPLSQLVEDRETRTELQSELPARRSQPQVLVRIGWQEISRSTLPRTPRRSLDDVLRP